MTSESRFRTTGDIIIKNKTTSNKRIKGKKIEISYGSQRTTDFENVAIIQARQPLELHTPYFLLEVKKCDPNAIIAIGIAPIELDRHTGQYNNSLGYHSNTGRVYTSWKSHANTLGIQYGQGDTVAIYLTHFGVNLSSALVYYNNFPIATRYHFETNKERFLPTVTFSGGPSEVSIIWPSAIDQLPSITEIPVSQWIRAPMCGYDPISGIFDNRTKAEDLPIQSPTPLSKDFPYFIVTQEEISSKDGKGASVGLATLSPLKPSPTCLLLKDYYTWFAKMRMKVGNTIGWGIFYDEKCEDDSAEQLALVFVMFNNVIVDALFVLQPEGGFVPIVLLQPFATKVSIEKRDILTTNEVKKLQEIYAQKLIPAKQIYQRDLDQRELSEKLFRKSEQVLLEINENLCRVSVPRTENSIHYIQFYQPLTPERRFFFVELENISKQCRIIVGIASSNHELNDVPGMDYDTVGYNSYTGHLYTNRKDKGNTQGHTCQRGDTMGVEIDVFSEKMSVVLFSKNFRPIGTRYLTLNNQSEYFPTISIESSGDPVDLIVHWQNRVSVPPYYSMRNPEDWCLPAGTEVDLREKAFKLPHHFDYSLCIQAPASLNKKHNHFEIILVDEFSDGDPPPAIALCTASPLDPTPASQFKQDFLRFWPTGDAAKYLKKGDRIGWGIIFPEDDNDSVSNTKEQLIICFLTINRTVGYVRVLYEPIGGLYPVVIAPPNVDRIQMDFTGTRIQTDDFTPEKIQSILADARVQIAQEEEQLLAQLQVQQQHVNAIQLTKAHPENEYIPLKVAEIERSPSPVHQPVAFDNYDYTPDMNSYSTPKSAACILL